MTRVRSSPARPARANGAPGAAHGRAHGAGATARAVAAALTVCLIAATATSCGRSAAPPEDDGDTATWTGCATITAPLRQAARETLPEVAGSLQRHAGDHPFTIALLANVEQRLRLAALQGATVRAERHLTSPGRERLQSLRRLYTAVRPGELPPAAPDAILLDRALRCDLEPGDSAAFERDLTIALTPRADAQPEALLDGLIALAISRDLACVGAPTLAAGDEALAVIAEAITAEDRAATPLELALLAHLGALELLGDPDRHLAYQLDGLAPGADAGSSAAVDPRAATWLLWTLVSIQEGPCQRRRRLLVGRQPTSRYP